MIYLGLSEAKVGVTVIFTEGLFRNVYHIVA